MMTEETPLLAIIHANVDGVPDMSSGPDIIQNPHGNGSQIRCHCRSVKEGEVLECMNCGLYTHMECVVWITRENEFHCKLCHEIGKLGGNIISRNEQVKLLRDADVSHPGIAGMRVLLRNVHWTNKDKDIKDFVGSCVFCVK
eukprot:NODE_1100_length_2211_cov_1.063920.p1 type:complete len:142 gc:universal NODE_1100_length_2211_cov_1.063920:1410-1835(+)